MSTSKYISFDLYDTVLMRRTPTESGIYKLCWEKLKKQQIEVPALGRFIELRQEAHQLTKHIDAPTLSQILDFLPDSLRANKRTIEAVEIEIELQQLVVIPGMLKFIAQCRENGNKLAFISDMHLSSNHLTPKLQSLNVAQHDDIILVSSDVGMSKARNGKLFKHFLDSNKLAAGSVTHYGNDSWSDIKMARKAGISSAFTPRANFNNYEKSMLNLSNKHNHGETLAAASRTTRLRQYPDSANPTSATISDREVLIDVASSVAAPILYSFVLWAIDKCRKESLSTVRFLTRDGELLKAIADELPPELTAGLDIQLLEVSRKSLVLPAASVIPIKDWVDAGSDDGQFLSQHYDRLPAEHLVQRAGLSFEHHSDVLAKYGLVNPDSPLGEVGLGHWKRALRAEEIQNLVLEASEKELRAVETYFNQSFGERVSNKIALIDVGWTGQQAAMLSALIGRQFNCDPHHIHIGRLKRAPLMASTTITGWLFDETQGLPSPITNPVALFESFLATNTGGVLGYDIESNGRATVNRRVQEHESELLSWGQQIAQDCVIEFARVADIKNSEMENDIGLCKDLLTQFWNDPTQSEARVWGAFPYEQDQVGKTIEQLAKPYSFAQVLAHLKGSKQSIDWKAGSIQLTASPLRQLIKLYNRVR